MITEDQLEQLAIQWFQDTGGENIEHRTLNMERRSEEKRRLAAEREALRTLTPALSHGEKEEDGRLVEAVRRMGRPFRAWDFLVDGTQGAALGCRMMPRWGVGKERGKPLNKERRYPLALTMRGPWGSGLPRIMGFPWARRIGVRRSLGMRWATCKGCLQVRLERNQKP